MALISKVFTNTQPDNTKRWRIMSATGLAHLFHDGATDMHYLLFAVWQQQFGLSLAQVGLLKMLFSGTMSLLQIPAGDAGHRWGPRRVLVGGTLLLSAALVLYGYADSLPMLMALIVLGGAGASVQHPLSSAFIAQSIPPSRIRLALSSYNFFGDVGKAIIPSALSGLILFIHWGPSVQVIGVAGMLVAMVLFGVLAPNFAQSAAQPPSPGKALAGPPAALTETRRRRAFTALCAIGSLDNATRTGTLTFLPFLLAGKGASATAIGLALTVIFIGGALGKLVCGALALRLGTLRTVALSEIITAAIIVALILAPLTPSYLLLFPLGIALNGTSSVLYGTVAELAKPQGQTRAFAMFYTASLGCGAIMPLAYGALGDRLGIPTTLVVIALLLLSILPLLRPLRVAQRQPD